MQMKLEKMVQKYSKGDIRHILTEEVKFITNLCEIFDVPETVDDDAELDLYLKKFKKSKKPLKYAKGANTVGGGTNSKSSKVEKANEEKTIMNKLKSKKGGLKKSKKDRLKKEMKKNIITAIKSHKNEKIKEEKVPEDVKSATLAAAAAANGGKKHEFNKDGNIVFSRVEFPATGSKFDRPKKKGGKGKGKIEKNPVKLIQNLKQQKTEIKELEASGEKGKAATIKKDIAWKKVFDKTEGKKIRDDPELIMKGLKQKRTTKKKSKTEWKDRKERVQKGIEDRRKKKQDNIDKRIGDKKTKRIKKMTKRGRVIPGF